MILVLGGSKSGKTAWAERRASEWSQRLNGQVVYLATARAWDDEMKLRIRRHQDSRPPEWMTIEEPLDIVSVLNTRDLTDRHIILIDCLTLWLTNLLMELGDDFSQIEAEEFVESQIKGFIEAAGKFPGEIIVVSNLVEQGLVSPHFLGRIFQELTGKCHQKLASESSEVFHIIAGLPQRLK